MGRSEETRHAALLAVKLIERRLDLNPDDVRALGLGTGAMIEAGRLAEGLAMVERSIQLAPDDATVLRGLRTGPWHSSLSHQARHRDGQQVPRRRPALGTADNKYLAGVRHLVLDYVK